MLDLNFTQGDFTEVHGLAATNLLKIAANSTIESPSCSSSEAKELSLKYQVLCDQTALVGVMKHTEKATGELKESVIKFEKTVQSGFIKPSED